MVVSDDGLADGLTDSYKTKITLKKSTINLSNATTTTNTDTDINVAELVNTEDHQRFIDFSSDEFRFDEVKRETVNLDEALTFLAVSDSNSGFL